MTKIARLLAAIVVAAVVGFGYRAYDLGRGAEWEVSPQLVADAKSAGGTGVETKPGTVTVLPIRSETADVLPYKWAFAGLAAGVLAFVATRHLARKA